MKLGLNLLLWTGVARDEHLPLVDQLKAWGYDGVEMPINDPRGTPWRRFRAALQNLGMGCTATTCVFLPADPTSSDRAARQAALDHLKTCIDVCADLGSELLDGPLHAPLGKLTGKPRTPDEWSYSVETLRQAADYAAQAGVRLGIEFLNRFETYFLNCAADTARYVQEIGRPNVGVMYDTFHAHIEEKNVSAAIAACADRLGHVHLSENDRSVPGRGQVRWDETFAALRRAGYDRWMVVEAFGSAIPEIVAAACIWRRLFGTAEELAREAAAFVRRQWASA